MSTLKRWLARLAGVFAAGRRDRELTEELESHLRMEIEEQVLRGKSLAEARRCAFLRSGGIEAAKEAVRDQRGVPLIDHLRQDVRYAFRMIRRNPAFAAVTVLSLALGIGANTAVFSLTDAVFFRTLPVANPGELILFEWTGEPPEVSYDGSMTRSAKPGEVVGTSFSVPFFERVRSAGAGLAGVFAFAPVEQLNVVDGDQADIASGQLVSGDYYGTLGVRATRGRTIAPSDARPGADPVAVISYGYWQRRFGGAVSVVGKQVMINGAAMTIVGITPPEFFGTLEVGRSSDITLPISLQPLIRPGSDGDLVDPDFWWVQIIGRRRADVSAQRAQSGLEPIFSGAVLEQSSARPDTLETAGLPRLHLASGSRGPNDERRDYRLPLTLLTIIAGLILLIACANAANLLLARAAARQREISMRLAMGASRRRLIKQLLTESLLLVFLAEALGLLLAFWSKDLLLILRPDTAGIRLVLDARVLAVATAASVATAVLFGLAPALRATRVDVAGNLKAAALSIRGGSRALISRGLVVAQIAMSVVLLVGAALFLRTLHNLHAVDVGFDQDRLLLFRVDPRLSRYDEGRVAGLYRELDRQLNAIPGVRAVTFSRHAQLTGGLRSNRVSVVGRDETDERNVLINPVGPAFFETMELPIVVGRAFDARDDEHGERVAIINQTFARSRFPGENPIGHRLRYSGTEARIVGVAADANYYSVRQAPEPTLYISYLQHAPGQASFALRADADPLTLVPVVRAVVRGIDPTLSIFEVQTQRAAVEATLGEERLLATMSTAFGALALVLACIGVYGVLSYTTTRRTGEIGLRIALGASGRSILWLVTRRMAALVAVGVGIGLFAGVQSARLFARLLYGLEPADPLSILGAVSVISVVALVAAYLPANRARRVSPLVALRLE